MAYYMQRCACVGVLVATVLPNRTICGCVLPDPEGSLSGHQAQRDPSEAGAVSGHPGRDRWTDLHHRGAARFSAPGEPDPSTHGLHVVSMLSCLSYYIFKVFG